MKKDLPNRTGSSMVKKKKNCSVLYKEKNRKIDILLCIPEPSSHTPKTNRTLELEINSIPI